MRIPGLGGSQLRRAASSIAGEDGFRPHLIGSGDRKGKQGQGDRKLAGGAEQGEVRRGQGSLERTERRLKAGSFVKEV